MNELKAFFKICDKICFEPLGKEVFNFQSPKAYQYFINAKDTHKSFQALEVFLHGTACEFALQYLNHCRSTCSPSSPTDFIEWAASNKNETFHLIFQLVFNYALAIFTQKIGIRCNDVQIINAGRYKFMPLFYGFRHPIYQDIEYHDLRMRVECPTEVKTLLDSNMVFDASSSGEHHQGGDFCLEGKIKRHKMVSPKGAVSKEMWKSISRGLDTIEKICDKVKCNLHLSDEESNREVDLYDEIVTWRAVLRESEFLVPGDEDLVPKNIYKESLCSDIIELTEKAIDKMKKYWQNVANGKTKKNEYLKVIDDENGNISCDDYDDDYDEDEKI